MKKPPKRKPKQKHGRSSAAVPAPARGGSGRAAAASSRPGASSHVPTVGLTAGAIGGALGRLSAMLGAGDRPPAIKPYNVTRDQAARDSAARGHPQASVRSAPRSGLAAEDAHLARVARQMLARSGAGRGEAGGAVAATYGADERQVLGLLLLPFLLLAAGIGLNQSVRHAARLPDIAAPARPPFAQPARPEIATTPAAPTPAQRQAELIRATPRQPVATVASAPDAAPPAAALPALRPATAPPVPVLAEARPPAALAPATLAPPLAPAASLPDAPPVSALAAPPAAIPAAPAAGDGPLRVARADPPIGLPASLGAPPAVVPSLAAPERSIGAAPPLALPPLMGLEVMGLEAPMGAEDSLVAAHFPPGGFCPAPVRTALRAETLAGLAATAPTDGAAFGRALASAARRQQAEMVVYTDRYQRMSYPLGDVPALYGVCTDVVVRAYRALGLDLQALVHQTRVGSGDTSIDHRRVDTLRKFFATHGQSLPLSDFAEDYRPGDIVSYYRPQNRHSRTHIAIVSDEIGPSGRPMIIHNRGWGTQVEDALFVDEITGHYRFAGMGKAQPPPIAAPAVAAASPAGRLPLDKAVARKAVAPTVDVPAPPARRREARSGGIAVSR